MVISDPGEYSTAGTPAHESSLIAAARRGDRQAVSDLLASQYDRCYAVCRRMLGNEEDALDATQEAMIAIARGIGSFDERSRFSTWCYRVAVNSSFDELRRRKRRPRVTALEPLDLPTTGPDEVGEDVTRRQLLDWALHQLSSEQRAAVVLRDIVGLDYSEIAEALTVPVGTVRSRIARGRLAIAALLSDDSTVTESQRNSTAGTAVQPTNDEK